MLLIDGLHSGYGRIEVLHGVTLAVDAGEIVALVGSNGAGKTTLLRTLSGIQGMTRGRITYQQQDISRSPPHTRVGLGISQVPEGRQVFAPLSVEDNLRLGAYSCRTPGTEAGLDRIYALFPVLAEKRRLAAGGLSGGQQQMLAVGRAMMAKPKLLLLDEPSMGLAPVITEQIFSVIQQLVRDGTTVLLVEQNAYAALRIADRGYVIENGRIVLSGRGTDLLADPRIRQAYLGL